MVCYLFSTWHIQVQNQVLAPAKFRSSLATLTLPILSLFTELRPRKVREPLCHRHDPVGVVVHVRVDAGAVLCAAAAAPADHADQVEAARGRRAADKRPAAVAAARVRPAVLEAGAEHPASRIRCDEMGLT